MSNTYYTQFRARQLSIERKFVAQVYREVRKQYQSAIASVQNNGVEYTRRNLASIIKPDGILKVIRALYRRAAFIEANYQLSSLIRKSEQKKSLTLKRKPDASFGIGFDSIAGVVDEYFKVRQLRLSALPITETTKRQLQDHLFDEIDRGKSTVQAVADFRELALTSGLGKSSFSRNRAKGIIQTESTRAMSFGGLIGAYMSGVDVDKVWVTSADEKVRGAKRNVRYPHTVLDRQVTSLFGAFMNGEPIRFPGDPDASKANIINCRCSNFYKEKARPKPRVSRLIGNFLTDFFIGFFIGEQINQLLESE